ncbi:BppU family phage baseplate upper protein [Clostridium botulinum]|nr:BppU family phage baseplate upper protein [Clostridium botulinum]MCD3240925.1 BppU family phage baseplate upper protein [Clostridium botulinum D/C]MCD3299780.1 BppU family phage baseplate upper protein [Clostridium botulinum D/C]MCD3306434.1 BppU family phage baseplate upper protein [Clostridium botulinum D/C]MCD3315955.1 BppU family phage baseplate upper protein [Clostridium botulinum D/C]MCD3320897.1 BppU family phage baseplate upper protein [Clostridium botulinum D/C]
MEKVFNLDIDTKDKKIMNIKGLKQFDNNSILYITISENSKIFDLTDCTVRLNFLKEDKEVLLYMSDIVDAKKGKIKIKLSTQVLKNPGLVKVDLSIYDKNIMKITSLDFTMQVEKSIYSNEYYLQRADFDIVQSMHIDEEKRIKNEEKRISNETTREKNENIRIENENKRLSVEKTRVENENKRIENETTRSTGEITRAKNEYTRIENEKNRESSETIRVENEDKRIDAEKSRISNETIRVKEWDSIKDSFKNICSIEWDNVKNKPEFSKLGKVKSVNSKTGDVILKAKDITTENGTDLEKLNLQYEQINENIKNIQKKLPIRYVESINGNSGNVKISFYELASQTYNTYYVDETNGSDFNTGTSESQAFKSLGRAIRISNISTFSNYPIQINVLSNLTKKGQNETLLSITNFTGIIDFKKHQTEFGLYIRHCNIKITNLIVEDGRLTVSDSICHLDNCVFNHHADDTSGVFFQFCQLALDSIKFQGENNTKISAMSILHSFASIRGTKISNVKYGIECLASVVVKSDDLVFTNCQSQYVTSQGGKIFHS